MTDHATQNEWAETWKIFQGLWPTAKDLTNIQLAEWQARLRHLPQPLVRGAMRNVFANTKYLKPTLSAVLDEYHAIRRAHQNQGRDIRLRNKGVPAHEWAEIKREADQARTVLKSLAPADLERHKLTACKGMALVRGYNSPSGDREACNAHIAVAAGVAEELTSDPNVHLHSPPSRENEKNGSPSELVSLIAHHSSTSFCCSLMLPLLVAHIPRPSRREHTRRSAAPICPGR